MKNNKGFTLIELLAVVLLISIITVASFPSIKSMIKDNKTTKQEDFAKVLEISAKNYVIKNKIKSTGYYVVTYDMLISNNLIEDVSKTDDLKCTDETCFVAIEFSDKGKAVNYFTRVGDYNISEIKYEKDINILTVKGNTYTPTRASVSYEREPNAPVYDRTNMIPIVYTYDIVTDAGHGDLCEKQPDGDGITCSYTIRRASTDNWYNYNNGNWANVVTCKEAYRDKCLGSKPGDELNITWINSIWVWIPRFEYKTTNKTNFYDINFISKYTSTASKDYTLSNAFKFDGKNLDGIWMYKFLWSDDDFVIGDNAYNDVQIGEAFKISRSIELKNNAYGFKQNCSAAEVSNSGNIYVSDSDKDSNNLDTHLLKNSEWSTAAYLSHSKYSATCPNGTCASITKESFNQLNPEFTAALMNIKTPSITAVERQNSYNTDYSTHTKYGLYGMEKISSSIDEFTMGFSSDYDFTKYGFTTNKTALAKYIDLYSVDKLGNNKMVLRTGSFSFDSYGGEASSTISFRPVLVMW